MKTRKSDAYLILSSLHLGVSPDIVKLFGQVAKKFNTDVIHIGEIVSAKENKDLKNVNKAIVSVENQIENFSDSTRETTRDAADDKLSMAKETRQSILFDIEKRIDVVQEGFSKSVTFLVPSTGSSVEFIDDSENSNNLNVEYDDIILSKYLMLSAIQPVSDVSIIRPASRNAIQSLKQYGNKYSWIVPHPVPSVIPYPRPGLNNAHNYCTVGGMKHIEQPTKRQNTYAASHSPAAILAVVDAENGEFHAVHLHVDYIEKNGYRKNKPVILYDGFCFTANGVTEVDSDDRAVFVTDEHQPYQHAGVLGATRELNNIFQPSTFINGGDASDCAPVSRHALDKPGAVEGMRICDMISGLKKLMAAQTDCPSIKNKILIDSNHHDWVTQFVELHPQLLGLMDWETIAKQHFTDWTIRLRQGERSVPYKFGDYTIRHGDQESLQKAELIFENGKYLCGHFHRFQSVRRMVTAACGCELNPPYMKSKESDWQNQITSMTRYKGVTAIAPKIVLHDSARFLSRFLFRGEIIEVKRYNLK